MGRQSGKVQAVYADEWSYCNHYGMKLQTQSNGVGFMYNPEPLFKVRGDSYSGIWMMYEGNYSVENAVPIIQQHK